MKEEEMFTPISKKWSIYKKKSGLYFVSLALSHITLWPEEAIACFYVNQDNTGFEQESIVVLHH